VYSPFRGSEGVPIPVSPLALHANLTAAASCDVHIREWRSCIRPERGGSRSRRARQEEGTVQCLLPCSCVILGMVIAAGPRRPAPSQDAATSGTAVYSLARYNALMTLVMRISPSRESTAWAVAATDFSRSSTMSLAPIYKSVWV